MKIIKFFHILLLAICFGIIPLSSCKNVFEVPDASAFNEDDVFSSIENTRRLVYQMYTYIPKPIPTNFLARLNGPSPEVLTDGASAYTVQAGYGTHKFNQGALNSTNVLSYGGEYSYDWTDVREAYTLIERVNEVPNASTEEKQRIIAESKTIIANRYFEMFKRFGGVPIVKKKMVDPSEYAVVRSSLKDTYDFIIGLLDEAIANPNFPATTTGIEFGRMNKAFAYSLKARLMLFAASPLFNTATPYMDFGADNKLICFGNYDPNRWKAAADAAKEAITFCESNGYAVVNNQADPVTNYVVATERTPSQGNSEVIFGTQAEMAGNGLSAFVARGAPMYGYATNVPTQNQVERYRKIDGTFINWDSPIVTAANDPTGPYKLLEPRFQASIGYNGLLWYPGVRFEFFNGINGAANGNNGRLKSGSEFNYAIHKFVHGYENIRVLNPRPAWRICFPSFRLSELYFILAEATNEFSGPSTEVYNALNKVLNRSGMSVPVITGADGMRDFIKRERAIEFYFEDQRYFDLKRWLNGPQGVSGNIYNELVTKNPAGVYTYSKSVQEVRVWRDFYYLWPFPQNELNKNYGLVQNPGW
jgi:hypothetical protein